MFCAMRIIAFLEDPNAIKKIIKHPGLYDLKRKPCPTANLPPIDVFPSYNEQPVLSTHMNWLAGVKMPHPAQPIVLQEYIDAANEYTERVQRITTNP